jgi:hypothetical protein
VGRCAVFRYAIHSDVISQLFPLLAKSYMRSSKLFNQTYSTVIVFLTVLLGAQIDSAQAVSLVTLRSDLGANDQLNWSSLGPAQPFNILPNTFSATSTGNVGLTVSIPATATPGITPPLVFQTAPSPNGIPTNFASGDFILLTGLTPGVFPSPGNPGPVDIAFGHPIFGSGAQIAVDDITAFTATIAAYDSQNQLLGEFTEIGSSSLALDNSALFLGVVSETPNISRLEFSTSIPDRAFGLNSLSINATPVPEPDPTIGYVIAGIVMVVFKIGTVRKHKDVGDNY